MAKGRKTGGGSRKGVPNKRTQEVQELMDRLNCSPLEFLAKVTLGDVPCSHCVEGTVTVAQWSKMLDVRLPSRYTEDDIDVEGINTDRLVCPYCGGTEREHLDMSHRVTSAKELGQYLAPKRKAIEVSAPNGEIPTLVVKGVRGK